MSARVYAIYFSLSVMSPSATATAENSSPLLSYTVRMFIFSLEILPLSLTTLYALRVNYSRLASEVMTALRPFLSARKEAMPLEFMRFTSQEVIRREP